MVHWKQETPCDYHGFIVHILTSLHIITLPLGYGEPGTPSVGSFAAFLMASATPNNAK